ncbi:MAG: hypothetical protein NTW08_03950 [Gammaproteobacteria bacterium]|nr:hypothetical protein [Gammaproteobacteria bacterium]
MPNDNHHPLLTALCYALPVHQTQKYNWNDYVPESGWIDRFAQFLLERNRTVLWNGNLPSAGSIAKEIKRHFAQGDTVACRALPRIYAVLTKKVDDPSLEICKASAKNQEEQAQAITIEFLEGLINCGRGVGERLDTTWDRWTIEENLTGILYRMRFEIVERIARATTDDVHARNVYFYQASQMGYGVNATSTRFSKASEPIREGFKAYYSPLLIIKYLDEFLLNRLNEMLLKEVDTLSGMTRYSPDTIIRATEFLNAFLNTNLTMYDYFMTNDDDEITGIKFSFIRERIQHTLLDYGLLTQSVLDKLPDPECREEMRYWLRVLVKDEDFKQLYAGLTADKQLDTIYLEQLARTNQWDTVIKIAMAPSATKDPIDLARALVLAFSANNTEAIIALIEVGALSKKSSKAWLSADASDETKRLMLTQLNAHPEYAANLHGDDYITWVLGLYKKEPLLFNGAQYSQGLFLAAVALNDEDFVNKQLATRTPEILSIMLSWQGSEGETALEMAAKNGNWTLVEKISRLCSTDEEDKKHYMSVLFYAMRDKQPLIVKALLRAGVMEAKPRKPKKEGNICHLAVSQDDRAMLTAILAHPDRSAFLEMENAEGLTPIYLAIKEKKWEVVKLLLGTKEEKKRLAGRVLSNLACSHRTEAFSQFIQEVGLIKDMSFSSDSTTHNTLFHYIVQHNDIIMLQSMLNGLKTAFYTTGHAALMQKNKDGLTPFDLAVKQGKWELVACLVKVDKDSVSAKQLQDALGSALNANATGAVLALMEAGAMAKYKEKPWEWPLVTETSLRIFIKQLFIV